MFKKITLKDAKPEEIDLFKKEIGWALLVPKRKVSEQRIQNDDLLPEDLKNTLYDLQKTKHWRDQCQVAIWACKIVQPEWDINILSDHDGIPLYYFIFNARGKEMRGIWKSIYGTVYYAKHNFVYPKHQALDLLKFGFSHYDWSNDTEAIILVSARIALQKLLKANNIPLYMVDVIPKKIQGASVPAYVKIKYFI